jgi:hypothetical protein
MKGRNKRNGHRLYSGRLADLLRQSAAQNPRRCETNYVGAAGECLACQADQGEACKLPRQGGRENE